MKSYEQFLKECEEDLFEIKPSEVLERFLIEEKMETDKEKVYEKFINKALSIVVGGNPLPLGGGRSLVNS